ncbi:MAG TPA: hypothetical protein VIL19_07275 [Casimicrobiaceae bacterium]
MRVRQRFVDRQCLLRRRPGMRERVHRSPIAGDRQPAIGIRSAGIRQRVSRIERSRLLETRDALEDLRRGQLGDVMAPCQITLISVDIVRLATLQFASFLAAEADRKGLEDAFGNRILHVEHVGEIDIQASGP